MAVAAAVALESDIAVARLTTAVAADAANVAAAAAGPWTHESDA